MRDLSALPNLTLALVQTSLAWHDRQANLEHFELLLEQAKGADLIVLPEMFTTGFSMASQTLAEPENGPTHAGRQALRQGAQTGAHIAQPVVQVIGASTEPRPVSDKHIHRHFEVIGQPTNLPNVELAFAAEDFRHHRLGGQVRDKIRLTASLAALAVSAGRSPPIHE